MSAERPFLGGREEGVGGAEMMCLLVFITLPPSLQILSCFDNVFVQHGSLYPSLSTYAFSCILTLSALCNIYLCNIISRILHRVYNLLTRGGGTSEIIRWRYTTPRLRILSAVYDIKSRLTAVINRDWECRSKCKNVCFFYLLTLFEPVTHLAMESKLRLRLSWEIWWCFTVENS